MPCNNHHLRSEYGRSKSIRIHHQKLSRVKNELEINSTTATEKHRGCQPTQELSKAKLQLYQIITRTQQSSNPCKFSQEPNKAKDPNLLINPTTTAQKSLNVQNREPIEQPSEQRTPYEAGRLKVQNREEAIPDSLQAIWIQSNQTGQHQKIFWQVENQNLQIRKESKGKNWYREEDPNNVPIEGDSRSTKSRQPEGVKAQESHKITRRTSRKEKREQEGRRNLQSMAVLE